LQWLLERSGEQKSEIYSYVLMTNHVHLLLSALKTEKKKGSVPFFSYDANNDRFVDNKLFS
ncbi:MAG: hypothetical protein VSS75_008965, partial [Candidatus Parabeggiatoa sp.]|nr:hypothetical protein [Candidatus Parabeggiatoa sp.]